jgi:hypothetical protein
MKFDIFYQLPEAATQNTAERYRELIAEPRRPTVWASTPSGWPRFISRRASP